MTVKSLLFPKPMRDFKGQRWVRISVRTWHLLSMGFLLGGVGYGLTLAEQPLALWNTFLSGLVFSLMEVYATGIWLFQMKGQTVIVKFLLLGAAVVSPANALAFLVIAAIIGGVSSHMPGKYRYYSIYHGRVIKE